MQDTVAVLVILTHSPLDNSQWYDFGQLEQEQEVVAFLYA
jgi:hypothetical protein